jgi:hypothetical protein
MDVRSVAAAHPAVVHIRGLEAAEKLSDVVAGSLEIARQGLGALHGICLPSCSGDTVDRLAGD